MPPVPLPPPPKCTPGIACEYKSYNMLLIVKWRVRDIDLWNHLQVQPESLSLCREYM